MAGVNEHLAEVGQGGNPTPDNSTGLRDALIVVGLFALPFALPAMINSVERALESPVVTSISLGKLITKITQPLGNFIAPALRGVWTGLQRAIVGVATPASEIALRATVTLANGTQHVLAFTREQVMAMAAEGSIALINAIRNQGIAAITTTGHAVIDITFQAGTQVFHATFDNQALGEAVLAATEEGVAQLVQPVAETAIAVGSVALLHAPMLLSMRQEVPANQQQLLRDAPNLNP